MIPRATYRIQFHKDFTFADAEAIVPYLAHLGISHIYASPITVAQPGSTHGYDVVDPTRVSDELGGEAGFRSLVFALKAHRMGAIIDIVPNHMGIAGKDNHWWQAVLEHGPTSHHARFFDIDWRKKLLLPFLGTPLSEALASRALELRRDERGIAVWAYDTHRFPVRPHDREEAEGQLGQPPSSELLDRQHWRLDWWRTGNDALNWRRFFTITELAGLRIEDPVVFEAVHALPFRLFEERLIDGVRIDHVDGLADPAGYCRRLRERMPSAYIIVEKILAVDEPLPRDWGVDGTSGYDFMAEVAALLHDPKGKEPLTRAWAQISGRPADFGAEELQARKEMLDWEFEGQLAACVEAFQALASSVPDTESLTAAMLRRAIERLLWVFPVYRTYGTGSEAPATDAKVREAARTRALPLAAPGEEVNIDRITAWLAGDGPGESDLVAEAVRRFQQLSAPIAAKAVEDTAFYRYGPLLSRNDVGFDPSQFAMTIDAFHARMKERSVAFPRAMLATATHDHKRGEDVRARLAVLSEIPEEWTAAVERWNGISRAHASGLDPGDVYQLYQTIFGAWPDEHNTLKLFEERVAAWQQKALREAKLRSSWAQPNESYEALGRQFIHSLLKSQDFIFDLSGFLARVRPASEANLLVQAFLRCTAPGVPDLYQGTEFRDLSLVDPDNRRPINFEARKQRSGDPQEIDLRKQALIERILHLRCEHPRLWDCGSWEAVPVTGPRAEHVLAFARRAGHKGFFGAAALRLAQALGDDGNAAPPADWWGNTVVESSGTHRLVAELFVDCPVYLETFS